MLGRGEGGGGGEAWYIEIVYPTTFNVSIRKVYVQAYVRLGYRACLCFYDFPIRYLNCSEGVVCFVFYFITKPNLTLTFYVLSNNVFIHVYMNGIGGVMVSMLASSALNPFQQFVSYIMA
jgi:hypothetical protein